MNWQTEQDKMFRQVGFALRDATQREKLDIATWIVLSCLDDTQDGMTESDSYLDVVTRHCGDILTHARGRLMRYGNNGYPKR